MDINFERTDPEHWKNIYLIGYMGVGKSSVAKHLGEILDMTVIEIDKVIENYYGKTISAIFNEIGEEGFRALETLILATSITGCHVSYDLLKGGVFSCGGGVPLNDINVIAMQNSGRVVWLTATPETILERLTGDSAMEKDSDEAQVRPLLKDKLNLSDITEMMEMREQCYRDAADIIISTEGKTPQNIAGEIILSLGLIPSLS